uniref:Putative secreted protein n=1 Tax=Anopheles darlingi TaxID=43151 RepID=A0A2M4DF96_ANODA
MTLTAAATASAAAVALLALCYLIRQRANTTWHRLFFFFRFASEAQSSSGCPIYNRRGKALASPVCPCLSSFLCLCDAMRCDALMCDAERTMKRC